MDQSGKWRLAPAFDVIYSHNPAGKWTNRHQMSINGKRDNFQRSDLVAVGEQINITRPKQIIQEIVDVVEMWPEFARKAGIVSGWVKEIARHHRLDI